MAEEIARVQALDIAAIIDDNIVGRENEIAMYELNEENYRHAIAEIDASYGTGDDAVAQAMREHKRVLEGLLQSEGIEKAKSTLILKALKAKRAKV